MARTIAVIGASNTGKSTLVDRMCALEGQPHPAAAPGELRIATFTHLGETWQAIDTPGSIELLHVATDALLAADAAVVCVGPDPAAALLASPRALPAQSPAFDLDPGDRIEIAAPTLDARLVPATVTGRGRPDVEDQTVLAHRQQPRGWTVAPRLSAAPGHPTRSAPRTARSRRRAG